MRRHPALRQLSSEHHTGLVMARNARKAAAGDIETQRAVWKDLVTRFHAELDSHFLQEETGLLPRLRQAGERQLVERTLEEHQEMRALIGEDRHENLLRFADLLAEHIRFEEQTLFTRAQALLDLDSLLEPASGSVQGG